MEDHEWEETYLTTHSRKWGERFSEWERLTNAAPPEKNEPTDRRAEMERRLPKFAQPFLTLLSGKAGTEKPLLKNSTSGAIAVTLSMLAGGVLGAAALMLKMPHLSGAGLIAGGVGLYYALLSAAGGVRAANSVIVHHSTHLNLSEPKGWAAFWKSPLAQRLPQKVRELLAGKKGWNRFVGETLSTLVLTAPYDLYDRDHKKHHAGQYSRYNGRPGFQGAI